jgi:signal transduction histidine kinase
VRPDGTIRHIHAQWQTFTDESQKVVRMIGTAHDITERKALEDELSVYRHKLEVLNSTLESQIEHALAEVRQKDQMLILQDRFVVMGEMINNIAHQWRQPLNSLGVAIQRLPSTFDTAQFGKEYLEKHSAFAMEQIYHMSETIEVFRNFFKPDKTRVTFSVIQEIRRTLSLIEYNFYDLHIKTTLHFEGDPQVNGYPNEFAQVLLNILTNARDALLENTIDNALISINVISEDNTSVVTITDNAGGINDEILGRIFDPYFTTKEPGKGTGIGLFMSKTIIENHMGGRLTVRNSTDGAEFRIEF